MLKARHLFDNNIDGPSSVLAFTACHQL